MKLKLKTLAIFLFILYGILTFIIPTRALNSLDYQITVLLQNNFWGLVSWPFSVLSLIGSFELVSIFLLVMWFIYKKLNYFYVLGGFAIFHFFELIGKRFFNQPGPPEELAKYLFSFSFPSSGINPGFSYPSGHMGRTVFVSVLLLAIIFKSKKLSKQNKNIFILCVLIFNLLMFVSRIYLGEHWFTDVLGGSVLGASMALLALVF